MYIEIKRLPPGVPLKYFEIDAKDCFDFWNILKLPKQLFIREINKTIIKPHNYLAFTFIGFDITYSVNQRTRMVEKLTISENVIVYLPKWRQFKKKSPFLQKRYYTFLKMALYHEYHYHVYLYEEKQLTVLYTMLGRIKRPTVRNISTVIKNFQEKMVKEQEISHSNAPKGKPFCYSMSNFKNSRIN